MLRTDELDYDLPDELIATRPVEPRDACRLMVVSRSDPSVLEHLHFRDLPGKLQAGDLLVYNTSAVLPARLQGARIDTGGRVEGLYVSSKAAGVWTVLLRTKGTLHEGTPILLHTPDGSPTPYVLHLKVSEGAGAWTAEVTEHASGVRPSLIDAEILAAAGATPLPPYILQARKHRGETERDREDRAWYQTVYADRQHAGSVAAPTAGLHFTPDMLRTLADQGVQRADVVLHVGLGTFKPVTAEYLHEHQMHAEPVEIPAQTIAALLAAKSQRRRVIGVGTTSVRAVESLPHPLTPGLETTGYASQTRLFISPGRPFHYVDGLVTNFHLPRSTLLAMVGAMFVGGLPRLLDIYRVAVAERYRFFSYGDAMLILP